MHVRSIARAGSARQSEEVSHIPTFEVNLPYGSTAIRGGSIIVAPTGEVLAGPVYDEETILYTDIDPTAKTRSHLDFDVVGHYSRPDVFELRVDIRAKSSVTFE